MITFYGTKMLYKKFYFFFIKYKNEQKERKFWGQKKSKKMAFIKTKK